ncbi:MAG: TetR/AcrR family transcriptional regulator [Thermoplasmata archaeon]|nr:TetR/AcrR family transcriptional regulator [Thermoplasmata archaeon]
MAIGLPPDVSPFVHRTDTKDRFAAAFVRVLRSKEYGEVSVVDISAEAGLSRSTFYRAFESTDDLVVYGYSVYLADILSGDRPEFEDMQEAVGFMAYRIADVTWDRRENLRLLDSRGLSPVLLDAAKQLSERANLSSEDMFFALFHASGLIGWMSAWFREGKPDTREGLREMLRTLVLPNGHWGPVGGSS